MTNQTVKLISASNTHRLSLVSTAIVKAVPESMSHTDTMPQTPSSSTRGDRTVISSTVGSHINTPSPTHALGRCTGLPFFAFRSCSKGEIPNAHPGTLSVATNEKKQSAALLGIWISLLSETS